MKKIATVSVKPLTEPIFETFIYTCPNCHERTGVVTELGAEKIKNTCPNCGSVIEITIGWYET